MAEKPYRHIRMTAEEFEQAYAERSGVTVEWLRENGRVVKPCDCGEFECEGWQSVSVAEGDLFLAKTSAKLHQLALELEEKYLPIRYVRPLTNREMAVRDTMQLLHAAANKLGILWVTEPNEKAWKQERYGNWPVDEPES